MNFLHECYSSVRGIEENPDNQRNSLQGNSDKEKELLQKEKGKIYVDA